MDMLLLILGMAIILWAKILPVTLLWNFLLGLGLGDTYLTIMNLIPHYFGKTHYPRIIGLALPFSTVLGNLGSPITGWISDSTGALFHSSLSGGLTYRDERLSIKSAAFKFAWESVVGDHLGKERNYENIETAFP